MVEPTDIEKKSLEAHVELCAERYNAVDEKLVVLDSKITHLCAEIGEVKEALTKMSEKNNDRIISWAVGIIGSMVAIIGFLIQHYILK
jgi:chromosome segregation ATPase